jgi:hypothetical protein
MDAGSRYGVAASRGVVIGLKAEACATSQPEVSGLQVTSQITHAAIDQKFAANADSSEARKTIAWAISLGFPDTARDQLAGKGAGKRKKRTLCGSVDARVGHTYVRVHRRIEYDGRRICEDGQQRLNEEIRPLHVDREGTVERSLGSHCSNGFRSTMPALTNRTSRPPNSFRSVSAMTF